MDRDTKRYRDRDEMKTNKIDRQTDRQVEMQRATTESDRDRQK